MRIEARNSLVMSKADIAAKRVPSSSDLSSWIWVIPLPDGMFRVRAFEVSNALVAAESCIYDGDMSIVHDEIVSSIDDIDESVRRAGVDPDDLDAPWKCDFPL
jgi:hypothetical protein